jgi:hypothetical protein
MSAQINNNKIEQLELRSGRNYWNTLSPDNDTPAQFPTEIETNTSCSRGRLPARTLLLLKSTTTSLMLWMSKTTLLPLPMKRSYSSLLACVSVQSVPVVELPSAQLAFCASSCEAEVEDAETL